MKILRGTNWRGDATWHVYDIFAKATLAVFLSEAEANDFAYRRMRNDHENSRLSTYPFG